MPLVVNAFRIMRINLENMMDGKNPGLITVGTLTVKQLADINAIRAL